MAANAGNGDGRAMNILSFSGFIPEQICDTVRFTGYVGDRKISHYCGYAADFISRVMQDPDIDGAVFPKTCDSSRGLASYLAESGKFLYQFHIPFGQSKAAVDILRAGIIHYKENVESHFKISITDVPERTALVNERNRALRQIYEHMEEYSFSAYLSMIHDLLQKPLREQMVPRTLPAVQSGGKRVFLVGSLLADMGIVQMLEQAGLHIVGDRLTESKRLFSMPDVSTEGDIYGNIAKSMLENKLSPTQNRFGEILQEDMEEIRERKVQGVVFVTQKYCEPYDYLYSVYKEMLEREGVPSFRLVLTDTTGNRRSDFAVEAFADIL